MKKLLMTMVLGVAACGSETESASATSAAVTSSLEGTYDFLLERSDVAPALRARCAGDARCWAELERDARTEKIRFSRGANGELVFTSFAVDAGEEEVFLEAPLVVRETSPGAFRGKVIGWPKGRLAAQLTHVRAEMKLERGADGTLVVHDEKKGRLVYRRAS